LVIAVLAVVVGIIQSANFMLVRIFTLRRVQNGVYRILYLLKKRLCSINRCHTPKVFAVHTLQAEHFVRITSVTTTDINNFFETPCPACQQGKNTTTRFPTSTRTTSRSLELLAYISPFRPHPFSIDWK
jgi:hypothetical protein